MKIGVDPNLTALEVIQLRETSGWDHDLDEWEDCLERHLLNVSARTDNNEVVGVGFLSGTRRHADLVDLVVHPDFRRQEIARNISRIVVNYALSHKIKYFGLTFDKNVPWLPPFYMSEGFQPIDFAMQHRSSLNMS